MSTDHTVLDPRLPADLERNIFELAAETHLPGIPGLLLVARRVKIWTEPILYRTFIICETWLYKHHVGEPSLPMMTPKSFLQLLDSRPAGFFHDNVRHLLCANTATNESQLILAKCSGVQNLFFYSMANCTLLAPLAAIAPEQLHVNGLRQFFPSERVDYFHPLFTRVTHLELGSADFPADASGLVALPCLTHLSVNHFAAYVHLESALAHCAQLQVLVVVRFEPRDVNQPLLAHFAHEPRFVLLFTELGSPMKN
ncbi:hypothetical protein C8R43DRAFT_443692 [Mycena crocata]|nr:hypothetical protein C8R43DRAFT_443692 [Mycena crocata]